LLTYAKIRMVGQPRGNPLRSLALASAFLAFLAAVCGPFLAFIQHLPQTGRFSGSARRSPAGRTLGREGVTAVAQVGPKIRVILPSGPQELKARLQQAPALNTVFALERSWQPSFG